MTCIRRIIGWPYLKLRPYHGEKNITGTDEVASTEEQSIQGTSDIGTCHQHIEVLGPAICWTCGDDFTPDVDF